MRLIDADELVYSRVRIVHADGTIGGYNAVVMSVEIKDAPTVDAEPVVRCKDCRWWKTDYLWNGTERKVCVIEAYEPCREPDDYCSKGERREEVQDDRHLL